MIEKNENGRKLNGNYVASMNVFKIHRKVFRGLIDVINDTELSTQERILFLIIMSLSPYEGYCFAHNEFLSNKLGLSHSRVKVNLAKLEKKGLIRTEFIPTKVGRQRLTYIEFHNLRKRYLRKDRGNK